MKRLEALIAAAIAFCALAGGLVWQFGPYGLIGAGAGLLIALTFVDPLDMTKPKKG